MRELTEQEMTEIYQSHLVEDFPAGEVNVTDFGTYVRGQKKRDSMRHTGCLRKIR